MSQHTKGPWIFNSFSRGIDDPKRPMQQVERGYFVQQVKGFDVAECQLSASRDPEETKANARLIAAAPELLEACRETLDWLHDGTPDSELSDLERTCRRLLEAAIAKAVSP